MHRHEKSQNSKTVVRLSVPWVQIPPSPPTLLSYKELRWILEIAPQIAPQPYSETAGRLQGIREGATKLCKSVRNFQRHGFRVSEAYRTTPPLAGTVAFDKAFFFVQAIL